MKIAEVIIDRPNSQIDKTFDYIIPENLNVKIGDRVLVPFGRESLEGYCISIKDSSSIDKLKEINKIMDDFSPLLPEMIELMHYCKKQFHLRYADLIRLFIPSELRTNSAKEQVKVQMYYNYSFNLNDLLLQINKRASMQIAILKYLHDKKEGEDRVVLNNIFSASALKVLLEKNYVIKKEFQQYRDPSKKIIKKDKTVNLTKEQQEAIKKVFETDKDIILIKGVTGSGKTEVYMQCVQKILDQGKNAIILVPEISLTPQTLKIFKGRFGDNIAVLHSGLSAGERFDEWIRIIKEECRIVIGARSAIFAPIKNIGLIVIDEEHDLSYISTSNPRYRTIDIAKFRIKYNRAKLLLGTATPSLESYYLAKKGNYELININKRVNNTPVPNFEFVDMSIEKLRSGNTSKLSFPLKEAIKEEVEKGNQIMLFLNRRGYASFQMCKDCGYVAMCSDCDVSLTYHSYDNLLKCHYCGKKYKVLTNCPNCSSTNIKLGKVGTQSIEEELKEIVSEAKVLRLDKDTTTRKDSYFNILSEFYNGKAQILIGTQMITKGHDFPNVTLVGILDADMSIYMPDFRSNETTFQLLTQVAGRCGRSEKKGRVIVQSFNPRKTVLRCAAKNDYETFYEKEINVREVTQFPPFTTIIRILNSSIKDKDAIEVTKQIFDELTNKQNKEGCFLFVNGMKSPIGKVKNKFRYQIIIKINKENEEKLIDYLYNVVDKYLKGTVSTFIEIDPVSMV